MPGRPADRSAFPGPLRRRVGQDDAMGKGAKGKSKKSSKKSDKKSAALSPEVVEQQAAQDELIAAHEAAAVEEIDDVTEALRVREGFVLADVDTSGTPGF